MTPLATDPVLPASTRIDPSTPPMQGAAQTAKAPPSKTLEPRARVMSCGKKARSGHGKSPTKPSPITIRRKPANSSCVRLSSRLPIAAAPAPSSTKTTVNPSTNGTLASATRRPTPRWPKRPASTAEIADR